MYYSAPVTDYFIAKPKNCVTSSRTFIELVVYVTGEVTLPYDMSTMGFLTHQTIKQVYITLLTLFLGVDFPISSRTHLFAWLSLFNSYVGNDSQRSMLMYSEDGAMLTLGSTIVLSIAGRNVSFDASFIRAPPTRAQICLDGSNAHLFIDCSQIQSKPFVVTDPVSRIAIFGTPITLQHPFTVSCTL